MTLPQKSFIHENAIYNSFFPDSSAEGIFLYFKRYSLDKGIYFTRTLIFQINDKKKNLYFIGATAEVQKIDVFMKIATIAVDLAGILLPRLVWSISFWEQCSRAPPLFAPLP